MAKRCAIGLLLSGVVVSAVALAGESERSAGEKPAVSVIRTDGLGKPLSAVAALRLGSNLLRQESEITGLAVSPDGKLVATTGSFASAPICLWDSASGRLVGSLRNADDDGNWWNSIAFSRDGRSLAAGCSSGCPGIRIWDVATRRIAREDVADGQHLTGLTYSPDGQWIVAFTPMNPGIRENILLLDALTGKKLRGFRLPTHEKGPGRPVDASGKFRQICEWLNHFSFSADGRFLAGVGNQRTFCVWDLRADGKDALLLALQDGPEGSFSSVNFHPDASRLVLGGYRRIDRAKFPLPIPEPDSHVDAADLTVWSLSTGRQEREIPLPEPLAGNAWGNSKLSSDGKRVYWPTRRGIDVLDFKSGRVLQTMAKGDEHFLGMHSVSLSQDGGLVASAIDNAVVLWDARTGRRLHSELPGHNAKVTDVAFSAGANRVFTSSHDLALHQWDVHTGRCLRTMGGGLAFAVSRDSRLVAAGRIDGWDTKYNCSLAIVDAETGKTVHDIPITVSAPFATNWQLTFSPDAKLLALQLHPGEIRIIDVPAGHELTSFHSSEPTVCYQMLGFSADRKELFAATTTAQIDAWDVAGGRRVRQFTAFQRIKGEAEHPYWSTGAFAPDASRIVVAHGRSAYAWSLNSEELLSAIDLPADRAIRQFVFSPDGRLAATLEPARFAVSFIPGGWVQTGIGGIVRVWEIETGLLRESIEFPAREPSSFAFSPDTNRFATGMPDGTTLVWELTRSRKDGG